MNILWILAPAIMAGQSIKLGGVTILDLVVLFLAALGLIKLKFKLKNPPLFIKCALLFVLVALFSLLLTPLRLQPGEYAISFLYTVRFASYVFLGWLVYSGAFLVNKNILIFSGVVLSVLGLIQFIFLPDLRNLANFGWDPHYFRAVSTFLDPNFLGAFLVLTLLLTHNFRFFFILIFITLFLTFSRGAYLSFLVSFLTLSLLKKSFKLGILSVILFLALLAGFYSYQKGVAEPRGIDRTQSASFRFNTWKQGATLFQISPFLGVGFNTYRYGLREYHLGEGEFLQSHGSSTNDSSLLFVAATTGTLGLAAYLLFLLSLIKQKNFILTAGLLGLIGQSFFANTLFYPPLLLWIILISSLPKK